MRMYSTQLAIFILVLCASDGAIAAARVPASDAEVLEKLAFKPSDPVARALGQLRKTLQQNPNNREVAVELANRYYEMVGEEGDPRYLGYAEAALAPWWQLAQPPTDVQLIRARLRQFTHDFPGALRDLESILQREPSYTSARALRAIIYIVQARYPLARTDCELLLPISSHLVGLGCMAMIDGLTGKASAALSRLTAAYELHPPASNDEKMWVLLRLTELAQRRGQNDVAERRFKQALALGMNDTFLLAAYADLLLDLRRPAEVVLLLKDKIRSDSLLLRLVMAQRSLNLPTAAELEAALGARYAAAQLRGDTVHQQEEARFMLHVKGNPQRALWLSQQNWLVQREPRDARIFLEAAIATKDFTAAQPVMQWLAESQIEDFLLVSLGQQIRNAAQ